MNKPTKKLKRLFFDIETSPNVVYSWNIGYDLNIDYHNIIKERAIICICFKWEGEKTVNYLTWDKGDDKKMVHTFNKIIQEADEVIGHNGDNFDIKWFKTRCLYHGIENMPEFKSIDTLKISRKHFRFNSNKLDYIAKVLGLGGKMETGGFDLWKAIIEKNDEAALEKMVKYCMKDVKLLEQVYNKLEGYTTAKTHVGVLKGHSKCTCPKCGGGNHHIRKHIITAAGVKKLQLQCQDCGSYYNVTQTAFDKE